MDTYLYVANDIGDLMTSGPEKDIVKDIAARLEAAGIRFHTKKAIAGLAPDFIVNAPDGRRFIVDVKRWDFEGYTKQASQQAGLYKKAAAADGAFIVIPALKRNMPDKGVVNLDGIVPALLDSLKSKGRRSNPPKTKAVERLVFAAMPFAPEYEDVFFVAMSHSAEQVDAVCKRVDQREFQGSVVDEIHRLIRKSVAVFVDLSESKPNVLYEAGYAHALNKKCIHICSTPLNKLPFDVAQWKTTSYKPGQIHKLRDELAARMKEVLGG